MDMVDLDQFYKAGILAFADHHETAFGLVMDMFVIERREFDEGLIRLLEPVAHYVSVVVQVVNEMQIFALQGA
jgi:hypothetical protein